MNKREYTMLKLENNMSEAETARSRFVESFSSKAVAANNLFIHAVSWLEDPMITIAKGMFSEQAYIEMDECEEKDTPVDMIGQLKQTLLRNNWRGTSSSAYHNATEGSYREAAARFLRDMGEVF